MPGSVLPSCWATWLHPASTQKHSTIAPGRQKNAYTNATRPFAHSHIQPPPAFPLTAAYPYHLHILADLPHRKEVGQAGNLGSRANEKDKLMCTTCVDPCRSVTREPIRGAKGAPVAGPGGSPVLSPFSARTVCSSLPHSVVRWHRFENDQSRIAARVERSIHEWRFPSKIWGGLPCRDLYPCKVDKKCHLVFPRTYNWLNSVAFKSYKSPD